MDELLRMVRTLSVTSSAPSTSTTLLSSLKNKGNELQDAVRLGRRERANPGRDGRPRWKYVHKGMVYLTDEGSKREIARWPFADAAGECLPGTHGCDGEGAGTAHVVLVVDMSGSMRKDDVPGFSSRTEAVYNCLASDLVEPQLAKGDLAAVEVSLIEMQNDATVVLERVGMDTDLLENLQNRAHVRASSHGNYLPALDAALELLREDASRQSQLFLLFLSDGAPSDHGDMTCSHGYQVWQPETRFVRLTRNGKPVLQNCPFSTDCRANVRRRVEIDAVKKVREMGDLLGRDRMFIGTVAFGPPSEDYAVLQAMAKALPRSSFQKLGLSADCLRTALTSLTSTLTTLRTEALGSGPRLTPRTDVEKTGSRVAYSERQVLEDGLDWDLYTGSKCMFKKQYELATESWVDAAYHGDAKAVASGGGQYGVAHGLYKFAVGAERVVFQCTECVSFDGGRTAVAVGPRLVAKEPKFKEHMDCEKFQRTFLRTQGEAQELAVMFNRRLNGPDSWQVNFLPCFLYRLRDSRFGSSGYGEVLVEQELDGRFTKWNNNAGGVAMASAPTSAAINNGGLLGAINEDEEEEEEEEEEDEDGSSEYEEYDTSNNHGVKAGPEHVPQAFSHFTFNVTFGRKLVCDLQGVWNATDGYQLTDPVIHHYSDRKHNGATDKGPAGMKQFFHTHTCNPLCARLGLAKP